jgi:hypothetical protein
VTMSAMPRKRPHLAAQGNDAMGQRQSFDHQIGAREEGG